MELTPENIAAEVKSSVDSVKNDMATVQASVDALRLEVKSAASARTSTPASDLVAKLEVKSAEIKGQKRFSYEVKDALPVDMLRSVNGASQAYIGQGATIMAQPQLNHITDFLSIGTFGTRTYVYDKETAVSGAAGLTAEGQRKNQISFATTPMTANAAKITAFYKVSTELVHDNPGFAYSLQGRGAELLKQAIDKQLLYGTGGNDQVEGLYTEATAFNGGGVKVTAPQNIDVLVAAANQVSLSEFAPDTVLLSRTDFANLKLTKDLDGRYIMPSDLAGLIGVSSIGISNRLNKGEFIVAALGLAVDTFWVEAPSMQVSNVDGNDFTNNMVTVLFEARIIQAVVRPAAIVKGTFATATAMIAA